MGESKHGAFEGDARLNLILIFEAGFKLCHFGIKIILGLDIGGWTGVLRVIVI